MRHRWLWTAAWAAGCGAGSGSVCAEPTWFADFDGDGHAAEGASTASCVALPGFVADTDDCNDDDATVSPTAEVVCGDGVDNVCGRVDDCGLSGAATDADAMTNFVASLPSDEAGRALAVGHADADGVPDVVIGAPEYSTDRAGAVYVMLGGTKGQRLIQEEASRIVIGPGGTRLGHAVAMGDVDGDGLDDVIAADALSTVYVVWAGSGGGSVAALNADTILAPTWDDAPVVALVTAHLDDDARADVVVGTDGGGVLLLSAPDAGARTITDAAYAWLTADGAQPGGSAVATAGDLDGDGLEDLIVGAPAADLLGTNSGAAYLVVGPVSGDVPLVDAGTRYFGEEAGFEAGSSVAGDLDVTGDGLADALIGAAGGDRLYVVDVDTKPGSLVNARARLQFDGTVLSVSGTDIDGDGVVDPMAIAGERLYVVHGPVSGTVNAVNEPWATVTVPTVGIGQVAVGLDDVDDDGSGDVLLAAFPGSGDVSSSAAWIFGGGAGR